MSSAAVTAPAPDNTPTSVFGGYLEIAYDNRWGYSGNTAARHNIKTGNYVPVEVLAEVDQKTDDGKPGSGRFRFSTYAGAGQAPLAGGAPNGCTDADSATASWLQTGGADNCGATTPTLLRPEDFAPVIGRVLVLCCRWRRRRGVGDLRSRYHRGNLYRHRHGGICCLVCLVRLRPSEKATQRNR